jgi:uncharacterized DUF497 family protein
MGSFYTLMFAFDPIKSAQNKTKHGIDFIEAQAIWTDERRVETPAQSDTEERFQILGMIGERCWSAFVTYRDGKIRLISVRRAREEEKERYHG